MHCSSKLKWNIIFYSVFTLLFLFFILSFILLSPSLSSHCLSISSFFLHRPTDPSFLLRDPSPICTSPAVTDPSLPTHVRPPTWPISASLLYFRRFGFVFRAVLVFQLCVSALCFRLCLCFGFVFQACLCACHRHRPLLLPIFIVFSFSLSIFSSDRVPHYPTHLKLEHSVLLYTHHHCLWSLIDDQRKSRQPAPNRTEYQKWVSVWLCWFLWVFVLFFFTGFDGTVGLWLCSKFHGFDGGCGGVLVVERNIILF